MMRIGRISVHAIAVFAMLFIAGGLHGAQLNQSRIIALDSESGDTIKIFNVETGGERKQVISPFLCGRGERVRVYLIGYGDTCFIADEELHTILMKRESIELSPVTVTGEQIIKSGLDEKKTEGSVADEMAYSFPSLQLKRYGRTVSYSVNGFKSEQTDIQFEGFSISNSASGMIDPYLIPAASVESIRVSTEGANIYSLKSPMSGSINFISGRRDGIKTFISAGPNGNRSLSASASYGGFKAGYGLQSYGDMKLPNGNILNNSFKEASSYSASYEGLFFRAGCLWGESRTGDFGTEGSFFDSSVIYQRMNMIFAGLEGRKLGGRISRTDYYYSYDCRDLGIRDSSEASNTSAELLLKAGNHYAGLSAEADEAEGSRIGRVSRIISYASYSFIKSAYFFNLKISSCPQAEFTAARSFEFAGFAAETGIKRRYRIPTFNELYWSGDRFAAGNESLKSELLHSVFIFAYKEHEFWQVRYEAGANLFSELIEWTRTGSVYTPVNISKVINPYASSGFIWQNGIMKIENDIRLSPYVDLQEWSIVPYKPVLSYSISAGIEFAGFCLKADGYFSSRRYINTSNTKYFPETFMFERVSVEKRYKGFYAGIEFINPLNAEIEDVRGYPAEGRRITFYIRTEEL